MDLQALINARPSYSGIELPPGEFFGQVTIDKPLTIVGKGKSTWIGSRVPPTVRITSHGVKLQNLMVECTAGSDSVAIEAEPGSDPILENVVVKGLVVGVPQDNTRDQTQDDGLASIEISFLPPPPMSVTESGPNARVSGASSPERVPLGPAPSSTGSKDRWVTSPRNAFLTLILVLTSVVIVVVSVVTVLQYIDRQKTAAKGIDSEKQQLTQEIEYLKKENRRRLQQIAELTDTVSQLKRDNYKLKDDSQQKQQEVDSLKRDKRRLEQQIATLTATLPQESRPEVRPVQGRHAAELMFAAKQGDANRVQRLLDDGADFNYKDRSGWTPLMIAAASGGGYVVKLLLERGADVNDRDNSGWTPLMFACNQSNMEAVRLLLERGADVNAATDRRWTPLMFASRLKAHDIERLLRLYGAKE